MSARDDRIGWTGGAGDCGAAGAGAGMMRVQAAPLDWLGGQRWWVCKYLDGYLSSLPVWQTRPKLCRRQAGQPTGTRCEVAVPPLPPGLPPPAAPSPKLAQPSQPSPAARRGNFTTASKLIKNCRLDVLRSRPRTHAAQITRKTHAARPNASATMGNQPSAILDNIASGSNCMLHAPDTHARCCGCCCC